MYFKLTFSDLTMIYSPFMGELQEEVGRKVHLVRNNENTSASASYTTACMYTNNEQAKIHLVMNNNSANERLKCLCSLYHEYCTYPNTACTVNTEHIMHADMLLHV